MSTKSEKALAIFKANINESREFVVNMFMSDLDMTKQGATTYYYNCKNIVNGPKPSKPINTPKAKKLAHKPKIAFSSQSDVDLFTVCTIEDDVVVETNSYMDLQRALLNKSENDVIVKHLPEIGTKLAKLNVLTITN